MIIQMVHIIEDKHNTNLPKENGGFFTEVKRLQQKQLVFISSTWTTKIEGGEKEN